MSTLNVQDQMKGWNDSYFDYVHFAEGLSLLNKGKYDGEVSINLLAGRKMQGMREGMRFVSNQLSSPEFANISSLKVKTHSYEYRLLDSLCGLGDVVSNLRNLKDFEVHLERHDVDIYQILDLISSLLQSKSLINIKLIYKNDIKQYEYFTFTSFYNEQEQSLTVDNVNFDLEQNGIIAKIIGKMDHIKHFSFTHHNNTNTFGDFNLENYYIILLKNLMTGRDESEKQKHIISLILSVYVQSNDDWYPYRNLERQREQFMRDNRYLTVFELY